MTRPLLRAAPALAALAALAIAGVAGPPPAHAATSLNGSGSSWSGPALDQWRRDVGPQGINIDFSANGSAAGRQDWELGLDDFTASDVPFRTSIDTGAGPGSGQNTGVENPTYRFSYVPVTAGGTSFMYNLVVGGKQVTNLRLSPNTLVGIFTNKITFWDDPAVTADYGAALPHIQITPVIRSDGSGATAQFTRWMEHTHAAQWDAYCTAINGVTCGDYTEFFPGAGRMAAENGSDQVANYIMSPNGVGSIGYDEYSYAKLNNWPVAKVLNPAGYYSLPTASNVAVALTAAKIRGVDDNTSPGDPNYLQQNLDGVYTNPDPRSYPISSYSYLIVPRDVGTLPPLPRFTTDHGSALSRYISYILCAGQGEADELGYSPIPRNLVRGGMLQNVHIPGQQAGVDPNSLANCPNPTFNSAGQLTLLVNAPQPSPCDKSGASLSCTAGGSTSGGSTSGGGTSGGSTGGHSTSGGTSGGSGTSGGTAGGSSTTGGGTSTTGGGPAAATSNSDASSIDPLTGLPDSSTGGASGGGVGGAQNIAASYVDVPGHNDQLLLSTLTALELLAAVGIPPVLAAYLARRRRMAGAAGSVSDDPRP